MTECWECSRTDGTHQDHCPTHLDSQEKHIEKNKRQFIHDCERCMFYGQAMYDGTKCDFYICPKTGHASWGRSVIARYGNEGFEYASGPLFGCCDLTRLDWFVLARGVELTAEEIKRLAKILLHIRKDKFSINDYKEKNLFPDDGEETMFGKENWLNING